MATRDCGGNSETKSTSFSLIVAIDRRLGAEFRRVAFQLGILAWKVGPEDDKSLPLHDTAAAAPKLWSTWALLGLLSEMRMLGL